MVNSIDNHNIKKRRKQRPTLRNKRIKMLKSQQIFQDLRIEKLQVKSTIKKLQKDFYKDKKISESKYKNQFHILNERLAEIGGKRTTLELLKEKKSKGVRKFKGTEQKLEKAVAKAEREI